MSRLPVSADERRRLQALHDLELLDTAPDATLDALVRVAARTLDCPVAGVGLLDADRQWFLSALGLKSREIPRDLALCSHTVSQGELLVVPDVARDPRFAGNPLLSGSPPVAFYAGVPLLVGGQAVGTLCVIDHQPGTLSQPDRDLLTDLGKAVEHWLESRRAQRQALAQDGLLRRLSMVVQQASEAICITDLQGHIEYVNRAACDSSGYQVADLIGRNASLFKSGNTPAPVYRELWARLYAGQRWRGFLFNRRKDGREYVEFATIMPVRDGEGQVTHYLAIKEDVTEKRRMSDELERYRHRLDELVEQRTAELQRARSDAEAASAAKSAFLATMSHEIRTPMNGVMGIVDVLKRTELTSYQQELTHTISESATALLRVIDDILDFSKIEAGKLELEALPFDLEQTVEACCDTLQSLAAAGGVSLRSFIDPTLPTWRVGDALRLRQILINLVGNAIKFSSGTERAGRVSLRVRGEGGERLVFEVSDNGIGIDEVARDRLFQAFEQGEQRRARVYGGTGLGLAISQRLAAAMGGRIACESRVGEGSLFRVVLKLVAAQGGAEDLQQTFMQRNTQVLQGVHCHLQLDDNDLAADWSRYLEASGANVHVWSQLPDLEVLTDPSQGAPVLLLSASVLPDQLSPELPTLWMDWAGLHRSKLIQTVADAAHGTRSVAFTAAAVLPQPIQPVRPAGSAPSALRQPPQRGLPRQPMAAAAEAGRVVLVAEDNPVNRQVIEHQLHLLGLDYEVVEDGAEALHRLLGMPLRYGVLLTDLYMPRLDGYDLALAVREAEEGRRHLPIVALTANALQGEAQRCSAVGMDGYLAKPVQLEQLRAALARWLPMAPTPRAPVS
jgi:PAS domain S-box-containing protein